MWSFFSRDPSKDFNFEIGEVIAGFENRSIWSLHKGKKKGTNEEVSIFTYDLKSGSDTQLEIAKAAVKRLKTLRHPSILTYLDSLESDKFLYLVTEHVEPLSVHLEKLPLEEPQKDLYVAWGVFQITRALSFLNNDGSLRHNNVNIWSVFVNNSGEWKLGGVEYVSSIQDSNVSTYKVTSALEVYDPPERNDPSKMRSTTKCSLDMWGLGCLIWEVFNGPLYQQSSLRSSEKLPRQLTNLYSELIGSNPQSRPNPADIINRRVFRHVRKKFPNLPAGFRFSVIDIRVRGHNAWPPSVPEGHSLVFYGSVCGTIVFITGIVRVRRPLIHIYF